MSSSAEEAILRGADTANFFQEDQLYRAHLLIGKSLVNTFKYLAAPEGNRGVRQIDMVYRRTIAERIPKVVPLILSTFAKLRRYLSFSARHKESR
jgi:hypothetical protein